MAARTDRHNNPTAFTTDIARQARLVEGVDYEVGDEFPDNPNLRTARILGDPLEITMRVLDRIGFYTKSGYPRWNHTAMPKEVWDSLTIPLRRKVIACMYEHEKGTELRKLFG